MNQLESVLTSCETMRQQCMLMQAYTPDPHVYMTYICEHMKDENACKGPSYDAYLTELALILAEGKRQGCSFAG